MEREEIKVRQKEIEIFENHSKQLKLSNILLTILIVFVFSSTCIICEKVNLTENKVDQRYFNIKEVIAMTNNIWVDEFSNRKFTTKEAYIDYRSRKTFKKQSFVKKSLKDLLKNL